MTILTLAQRQTWTRPVMALCAIMFALIISSVAQAHGVAEGDQGYVQEVSGVQFIPFMYLGAKHMVTGYDHLLFLFGVIFFLYRLKHIAIYVTLFAIGHSTTMLFGVLTGVSANAYRSDRSPQRTSVGIMAALPIMTAESRSSRDMPALAVP